MRKLSGRREVPSHAMAPVSVRSAPAEAGFGKDISAALRAFPFALLAGIALLLGGTLIALSAPDPDLWATPVGIGAAAVSCLTGGALTMRRSGHSVLLSGLCFGMLFTAFLMLVSLCFFREAGSGYSPTVSLLLHTAVLLAGPLGARIGALRPKVSPRRSHRLPSRH